MCEMFFPSEAISVQDVLLFLREMRGEADEIIRQLAALGVVGEEIAEIGLVLLHEGHGAAEIDELRMPHLVADERVGNIHAVEHVADVVQHAGGDLGHAGLARRIHELLVHLGQFVFRVLDGGDVLGNPKGADDFAGIVAKRHLAGQRPGQAAIRPRFLFDLADHGLARADDSLLVRIGLDGMIHREKSWSRRPIKSALFCTAKGPGHAGAAPEEPRFNDP